MNQPLVTTTVRLRPELVAALEAEAAARTEAAAGRATKRAIIEEALERHLRSRLRPART